MAQTKDGARLPCTRRDAACSEIEKDRQSFFKLPVLCPKNDHRLLLEDLDVPQAIDRVLEHPVVALREMQTNVVVHGLAEEARSRNGAELHLFGEVEAELIVVVIAEVTDVDEHEVRALRTEVPEAQGIES